MSQPEAKFKRKLVEAFESVYPDPHNWSARVAGVGKDGVPDLVFHTPVAGAKARTLWVEAKHADNACSPAQRLQLLQLRSVGASCCALRCPDMSVEKAARAVLLYQPRQVGPSICMDMIQRYNYLAIYAKTFWEGLFAL
jgi:hypothetical protein